MTIRAPHKWFILADVVVSFTLPGAVHDDDWMPFVNAIRNEPVTRYLGTAIGVIDVTSVQRKLISTELSRKRIPVAAVTDERVIRGIATAVSWLGVDIKAFAWADLRAAIAHLKITDPLARQLYDDVMRLKTDAGVG